MALPPLDRGLFAADAAAVAELLPVPGVSPLRLRPGRALLLVEGADLHQHRTGLPPTRGAFVALSAMVTIGRDPAPVLLPLLSDRIGQRYRIGVVPLRFLITNPVEAQLLRRQFGFDMRTADIERRVGRRAEESACQRGSRPILRLRVRTDGTSAALPAGHRVLLRPRRAGLPDDHVEPGPGNHSHRSQGGHAGGVRRRGRRGLAGPADFGVELDGRVEDRQPLGRRHGPGPARQRPRPCPPGARGRCRGPLHRTARPQRGVACDLGHAVPWPRGQTTAANLGPLCRCHHLLTTHDGWDLDAQADMWRTPAGAEVTIAAA